MTFRSTMVFVGMTTLATAWWVVAWGQAPAKSTKKTPAKATQSTTTKSAVKKGEPDQPASPVVIDEAQWPADSAVTVKIEFGLTDTEPTSWDGRVGVMGAKLLRLRPWRFGPEMRIDAENTSWQCQTWLGPTPLDRTFDRHLPNRPHPFLRPGVLIDLSPEAARGGKLDVQTPVGKVVVDLGQLARSRTLTLLDGRVRAELAVFGFPVAARRREDQREWYDDPALAVRMAPDEEVAVSYLTYSQDTTSDAIYVRRRSAGKWQAAELVSPAQGDHYRSSLAYDASGDLWVAYAAQVDGNWDLYARRRTSAEWTAPERLTRDDQPDMHPTLLVDRAGTLWLVWQGFREGQSEILVRRREGNRWGDEQRVSQSASNDWNPAVTPLPEGGIAVAWDTYEAGNYDIRCRRTDGSGQQWSDVIRVTESAAYEARPSIAADRRGRLWIAHETAGVHWGKDTGFMLELAQAPQGSRLYEGRSIEVAVVDSPGVRVLAPQDSTVRIDSLNPTLHEHVEYPQLVADDSGRMWLVMRRRALLNISRRGIGRMFGWDVLVSRLDAEGGRWMAPVVVADSLGRLDSLSGMAVTPTAFWLAWSHDHRTYSTNRPDASSIFAGRVSLSESPASDAAATRLVERSKSTAAALPPPAHPNEAEDVARIRKHAIRVGDKTYHIYRGDMHRHTETSSDGGGDGSMLDTYRYAIDAAAMDFLLVTDHHDGGREYDWWRREKFNDLFRIGESFVGLFGYERSLSYPNGHRNVFYQERGTRPLANLPQESGRDPIGSGKFLYPHLRERGGICFSHTSATGMGTDWRDNDPELEPLVEIFQGDRTNYERLGAPWSAHAADPATQEGGFQPLGYVNLALEKGYKLGFQASSDHLSTHLSYSCILSENNTREALMKAMQQRHAYAATDNILLDVQATGTDGGHIMGDAFRCAGWPKLRIQAVGTGKLAEVVLIKNDRVVYSHQPDGNELSFEFTDMQAEKGRESYYYVRVLQVDRQIAWGSPMWIVSE